MAKSKCRNMRVQSLTVRSNEDVVKNLLFELQLHAIFQEVNLLQNTFNMETHNRSLVSPIAELC
jgi:hypothetical protein